MPWIERYHSFGPDFAKQNELAFRLSGRLYCWPPRMSLVMADPRTSERTKQAVVHFASASYTNPSQWRDWHQSLTGGEDVTRVIAGTLSILRSARTLKPDGSDASWPTTGLLDPQGMPRRIVRVLKKHPELALDVIQALEAYGPLALTEAEVLMPLLLSLDPQVATAAQAAILKMDPQGLARLFHLHGKPLTKQQTEKVRLYTSYSWGEPWYDSRESDGSPQSELSRMRHELRRFMRFQSCQSLSPGPDKFLEQQELALLFRDQNLPGDWWKLLSNVYPDQEDIFRTPLDDDQLLHIASALYTKPGAQSDILRVLHDDNPHMAQTMAAILSSMRLYKPGITNYEDGDLVDPKIIPAELVKAGKRHPHLKLSMAGCLSVYKSQAATHIDIIVPQLLTNDTHDMQAVRCRITEIDPNLAKKLEITYRYSDSPNSDAYWRERQEEVSVDGPPPLTPRQRGLVETYLKEHRLTFP